MSAGAAVAPLALRVTVSDGWRQVALTVPPSTTAGEVKRLALAGAGLDPGQGSWYEVKFGGAHLAEAEPLSAAAVPDGAALVVLPARRRPVR